MTSGFTFLEFLTKAGSIVKSALISRSLRHRAGQFEWGAIRSIFAAADNSERIVAVDIRGV